MLHPYMSVLGIYEDELEGWLGPWGTQLLSLQFADHDESRGFPRGAQWDVMPLGGPLFSLFRYDDRPFDERWGPAVHDLIERTLGHAFDWGVGIEDLPHERNMVTLDPGLGPDGIPAPKVHATIDPDMRANLEWQLDRAREAHEAAGAIDTVVSDWSAWGWHLLGTARMGDDPATSVVDRWGTAHDVPNLYVMDGSIFVTSGPMAPTATICANALRCTERLIARASLHWSSSVAAGEGPGPPVPAADSRRVPSVPLVAYGRIRPSASGGGVTECRAIRSTTSSSSRCASARRAPQPLLPHRQCNGAGSEKARVSRRTPGMKAEGGWAAVCTEYCSIHPESDDCHRVSARLWDDGDVRNLARMTAACPRLGRPGERRALVRGRQRPVHGVACVPRAPSQIASEAPSRPHGDGGAGDPRAARFTSRRRSGRDGRVRRRLRLRCPRLPTCNSSALLQPPSGRVRRLVREPARYWRELLELVRGAIGEDCAIASRLTFDALGSLGHPERERRAAFIRHVDELVDIWDVNVGTSVNWGDDPGPRGSSRRIAGPFVARLKEVQGTCPERRPLRQPGHDGRGHHERAVRPDRRRPAVDRRPVPTEQDRGGPLDDIRECIGCNVCISRWEIGGPPLVCTQSATSGRSTGAAGIRSGSPGGERRPGRARRRRRRRGHGVRAASSASAACVASTSSTAVRA